MLVPALLVGLYVVCPAFCTAAPTEEVSQSPCHSESAADSSEAMPCCDQNADLLLNSADLLEQALTPIYGVVSALLIPSVPVVRQAQYSQSPPILAPPRSDLDSLIISKQSFLL